MWPLYPISQGLIFQHILAALINLSNLGLQGAKRRVHSIAKFLGALLDSFNL